MFMEVSSRCALLGIGDLLSVKRLSFSGSKLLNGLDSSPLADSERKDSLSVQVEFVKVNISRSRRVNPVFSDLKNQGPTKNVDVPGGAFVNVSSKCHHLHSQYSESKSYFNSQLSVSAVIDIGSASFKYDMRRLTEILAFPKAWYRKKIARRIFLGDQSSGAVFSDQGLLFDSSSSPFFKFNKLRMAMAWMASASGNFMVTVVNCQTRG